MKVTLRPDELVVRQGAQPVAVSEVEEAVGGALVEVEDLAGTEVVVVEDFGVVDRGAGSRVDEVAVEDTPASADRAQGFVGAIESVLCGCSPLGPFLTLEECQAETFGLVAVTCADKDPTFLPLALFPTW